MYSIIRWFKRVYRKNIFRIKKGWLAPNVTNLYSDLAPYILKRLTLFRKITWGYPINMSFLKWKMLLDEMIWAFWFYANEDDIEIWFWDNGHDFEYEELKWWYWRADRGLKLFAKYYGNLWI